MRLHTWLFVCTALATGVASANDDSIAGWQLYWDNDVWAKGHSDRWYTNGLRLSWTYNAPPSNAVTRLMLDGSRWFLWDDGVPTLSYSLGQSMYTPRDINVAAPQPNDRPWGAFLFFGVAAHADKLDAQVSEFRATELKLGTTGRYALGEDAQSAVHRLIHSNSPQGWDQQLEARLGVQLSHARVYQIDRQRKIVGFQWGWGVAAGTLRNYANVGVAMMVGDLSGSNSPLLIGNEGDFVAQDFKNRPQFAKPFGYVAGGVTGLAYNYFLEGGTPYGRAQIDQKRSYTMVQWGFSLPLQRWVSPKWPRLVYSQTARTSEFNSPSLARDEGIQRWGTFSFHWDLDD